MKSFMIICLYLLLDHHGSEGITTHSVTGCSNRVDLSCPNFEKKIHVERITYYNTTDCNRALTDQQVCGLPLTGSDTGWVPSCTAKISCNEYLYNICPGSKAAKVDYRCIPGNKVKDMCDETVIENTNRIFLSTPNYPSPPNFTNISPCRCYILGSNITSIEILELVLQTSANGTKSSLEINYGDVTYRTESLNGTTRRRVYNNRLTSTSTTAEIILNHNIINKQYLWIEIQGVSMRVSCNNATRSTSLSTVIASSSLRTTSTSSPPSSTISSSSSSSIISISSSTTTSSSPLTSQSASDESNTPEEPPFTSPASTSTPTTDSSSKTTHPSQTKEKIAKCHDNDQTNIALAVMLSLSLLVICLTVVVVFMLYRKGKLVWVKKSPEVGERNPYSGLDLTQRVAGSDGPYQVLNTRNSTPQYNNVSQPFHPEYQNVN